jgi:hypothetical protein
MSDAAGGYTAFMVACLRCGRIWAPHKAPIRCLCGGATIRVETRVAVQLSRARTRALRDRADREAAERRGERERARDPWDVSMAAITLATIDHARRVVLQPRP